MAAHHPPATRRRAAALNGFDVVYTYRDATGRPTHYVGRIEAREGKRKSFTPITYGELDGVRGWHRKAPLAPRPLYQLDQLAARPHDTVIITEGEKAADAAAALFPDYVAVSWMSGAEAIAQADLAPLEGRRIVIWPDNDEPGHKAADVLRQRFRDCAVVNVADLGPGDDAADLQADFPELWLRERIRYPNPT